MNVKALAQWTLAEKDEFLPAKLGVVAKALCYLLAPTYIRWLITVWAFLVVSYDPTRKTMPKSSETWFCQVNQDKQLN